MAYFVGMEDRLDYSIDGHLGSLMHTFTAPCLQTVILELSKSRATGRTVECLNIVRRWWTIVRELMRRRYSMIVSKPSAIVSKAKRRQEGVVVSRYRYMAVWAELENAEMAVLHGVTRMSIIRDGLSRP